MELREGMHEGLHGSCSPVSLLAGSLANTMTLFFFLLGWKVVTVMMPKGTSNIPVDRWENREEGRVHVVL